MWDTEFAGKWPPLRPFGTLRTKVHTGEMTQEFGKQRASERVPVNSAFASMPGSIYVSDLSEQGVFVHTAELIPQGSIIDVRFTVLLDDPVVIEARGKVMRHSEDPLGIGIRFTSLSPQMVLRIGEVLQRQTPVQLGEPIGGAPSESSIPTRFATRTVAGGESEVEAVASEEADPPEFGGPSTEAARKMAADVLTDLDGPDVRRGASEASSADADEE